jgi:hypothetical protein
MTSNLTIPKNNVPVGRITINGQTFDVPQHPEFVRFFYDLSKRVGGVTAPTNVDLEVLAEKLSAINPPSEVLAQAAERLAEDLHSQLASLRGSLNDANDKCAELTARFEDIPRTPDLSYVLAQLIAAKGPSFRAHANAGTAIAAANTAQKLNFQVVDWDTSSNFTSSRFQPTVAGYYQINGAVDGGTSTSYLISIIAKNGVQVASSSYVFIAAGSVGFVGHVADIVFLNGSTDYVELWAQSGAVMTTAGAPTGSYFSGCWLRS